MLDDEHSETTDFALSFETTSITIWLVTFAKIPSTCSNRCLSTRRSHYRAMFDATASTDRLIELILKDDKHVLKELLTTQKVVATKNDQTYFGRRHTPEEREAALVAKN
jgi:hypothetical protein